MKRTKEDAGQTKEVIVKTAYEVFKSVGYDKASLVDIAKNANLTRGAVYWHFKDKQSLYEYVVRWKLREVAQEKENLLKNEECTLEDVIRNLLKLHMKDDEKYFFINQVVYLKSSHLELSGIAMEVDDIKRVYFKRLELFINNKINADGKFDDKLIEKIVSFVYTLFEGVHLYNLQKIRGITLTEEHINLYTEIFMHGFNDIILKREENLK
jgi:TetR/AcrR family transcriptional regulator, acrAB operon repressor